MAIPTSIRLTDERAFRQRLTSAEILATRAGCVDQEQYAALVLRRTGCALFLAGRGMEHRTLWAALAPMADGMKARRTAPFETPYNIRFAFVNDPDAAPFLATADGEPAGFIGFRFRRRLNHATFEGWISDLVVRDRFRGRGIGRALSRRCAAATESCDRRPSSSPIASAFSARRDRPPERRLT